MKIQVKLKQTLYGHYGYGYAGDVVEIDEQDAKELEGKGVVEILKEKVSKEEVKEKKGLSDNPGATITVKGYDEEIKGTKLKGTKTVNHN